VETGEILVRSVKKNSTVCLQQKLNDVIFAFTIYQLVGTDIQQHCLPPIIMGYRHTIDDHRPICSNRQVSNWDIFLKRPVAMKKKPTR
jgi:hypothetical protein